MEVSFQNSGPLLRPENWRVITASLARLRDHLLDT
jgi:hypothetical protein